MSGWFAASVLALAKRGRLPADNEFDFLRTTILAVTISPTTIGRPRIETHPRGAPQSINGKDKWGLDLIGLWSHMRTLIPSGMLITQLNSNL